MIKVVKFSKDLQGENSTSRTFPLLSCRYWLFYGIFLHPDLYQSDLRKAFDLTYAVRWLMAIALQGTLTYERIQI